MKAKMRKLLVIVTLILCTFNIGVVLACQQQGIKSRCQVIVNNKLVWAAFSECTSVSCAEQIKRCGAYGSDCASCTISQ